MAAASDSRWVILVRGINLGKNKRLAMADFRAVLEALGYADVRTHLNTGNALVRTTGRTTPGEVQQEVAERLESDLGLAVKVLVRSAGEWKAAVDENPFAREGIELKHLQAAFLSAAPPDARTDNLDPDAYAPDRFALGDRVVYLHMPNGFAASRLPDWEKVLAVDATVRTWNVVTKLAELLG